MPAADAGSDPNPESEFALDHRSVPPETGDGPSPAVVLVHGRGADEADLLGLADSLPDDLHVLSVRAPTPLGPGYTWYELDLSEGLEGSQPNPEDFRRSRELLDAFVEQAVDAYDLDSGRVGLFGFSQGAILSMASILERPGRYAWCVALHGYLPESHRDVERFADAASKPAFVAGGERDEVIPEERSREAAERLREAGLAVRYEAYSTAHGIGREELDDAADWVARQLRE